MDVPFLIIFIISVLFLILLNKSIKRSFGALYVITIFVFLIATRSITVPDTPMYLKFFNLEDTDLFYYNNLSGFELGFRFFTKFIKSLTNDDSIYLASIAIFNMTIITYSSKRFIKNYNIEWGEEENKKIIYYSSLFLLLYIVYFGIYVNAIVLRVGMAYSLIYCAASIITDPTKNKYSKYITSAIVFYLAYLLHSTAVFGGVILLVLAFSKPIKKEIHLGILIVIFLIYFLNLSESLGLFLFKFLGSSGVESEFLSKLNRYDSGFGAFESQGFSLKFLFFWGISVILTLNRNENKLYYRFLNVLTIGVLIHAVFRSTLLVERITDYFTFYSFILIYLLLIRKKPIPFAFSLIAVVVIQLIFIIRVTNGQLAA